MTIIINKKGIKNFHWPISHDVYSLGSKKILDFIIKIQNHLYRNNKDDFNIFNCLKIFIAHKLFNLFLSKKISFLKKNNIYMNQKMLVDIKSGYSLDYKKLEEGLKKKNILFRYLRLLKNINQNFSYIPINLLKKKGMNIVVSNNHLIVEYLKSIKKSFFLFNLSEWFFPCSKKEYDFNKKKYKTSLDFINFFLNRVQKLFNQLDCKLNDGDIKQVKKFIIHNFFWTNLYLTRLDKKQDLLPINLLTGTQGIIWVRLLSCAVKKNGGNVISFDHAAAGDLAKESIKMFHETDFANIFYTFNSKHVKYWSLSLKKHKSKFLNMRIDKIKKSKKNYVIKYNSYNSSKKKILLIAQPFFMHDLHMTCFPQPVQFDWHLRLIHNLKKFGYDVTYKSHPLTNKKIVEKLCNTSDIKNKEGLLEKVYHKYNYLIFDCRSTSAWSFALSTSKPIIFIDFMKSNYFKVDNLILKKRVGVIKGNIDKNNIPQINFNKLKDTINYSEKLKKNKSCFNLLVN